MRQAGQIVGAVLAAFCTARGAVVHAAPAGPAAELAPDTRPVLVLEPPQGELLLVQHGAKLPDQRPDSLVLKLGHWIAAPVVRRDREERRAPLPAAWRTGEPDRGFTQALLMQLAPGAANSPWRQLIVSHSGAESHSQLQTLEGQDAVVAVVHDELVDLGGKVEYHVTMAVATVRALATAHESRVHTPVQYFAASLPADARLPHRSLPAFAMDGPLDEQVSTAATDLSQFLATIVARVSVPASLQPHNPTLGELHVHPACGVCRAADPVVYQQPGRVWVRVARPPGSILALPLQSARPPSSRAKELGSQAIP